MGCYVNPPSGDKEKWLEENATSQSRVAPKWSELAEGELPVCIVSNGYFNAAGVCYSERELDEFSDPSDSRPKLWVTAKTEDLLAVSDLDRYIKS